MGQKRVLINYQSIEGSPLTLKKGERVAQVMVAKDDEFTMITVIAATDKCFMIICNYSGILRIKRHCERNEAISCV